jgi:hypothetical protein
LKNLTGIEKVFFQMFILTFWNKIVSPERLILKRGFRQNNVSWNDYFSHKIFMFFWVFSDYFFEGKPIIFKLQNFAKN